MTNTQQIKDIKILNDEYAVATGPNGHVYICVKRKPHLCYDLLPAQRLGLIQLSN